MPHTRTSAHTHTHDMYMPLELRMMGTEDTPFSGCSGAAGWGWEPELWQGAHVCAPSSLKAAAEKGTQEMGRTTQGVNHGASLAGCSRVTPLSPAPFKNIVFIFGCADPSLLCTGFL